MNDIEAMWIALTARIEADGGVLHRSSFEDVARMFLHKLPYREPTAVPDIIHRRPADYHFVEHINSPFIRSTAEAIAARAAAQADAERITGVQQLINGRAANMAADAEAQSILAGHLAAQRLREKLVQVGGVCHTGHTPGAAVVFSQRRSRQDLGDGVQTEECGSGGTVDAVGLRPAPRGAGSSPASRTN